MKPIYLELSRLYFCLEKGIRSQLKVLLIFQKGTCLAHTSARVRGPQGSQPLCAAPTSPALLMTNNHRLVWGGRNLKDHPVPAPSCEHGHFPLDQVVLRLIQPGVEHTPRHKKAPLAAHHTHKWFPFERKGGTRRSYTGWRDEDLIQDFGWMITTDN